MTEKPAIYIWRTGDILGVDIKDLSRPGGERICMDIDLSKVTGQVQRIEAVGGASHVPADEPAK